MFIQDNGIKKVIQEKDTTIKSNKILACYNKISSNIMCVFISRDKHFACVTAISVVWESEINLMHLIISGALQLPGWDWALEQVCSGLCIRRSTQFMQRLLKRGKTPASGRSF